MNAASEHDADFTAQAVYTFAAGDKVQVLIREHIKDFVMVNTILTCTAT
jgi:hypothetical protein